MPTEAVQVPAADGRLLGAALSVPAGEPRGAVLIAGANGVRHRFYAGTAEALAGLGLVALRFDYRGLGESRREPVRHEDATMHDWGARDIAGALDWLAARYPAVPLHLLGHSAGGWLPGYAESAGRLHSICTVASQAATLSLWPWPQRAFLACFWRVLLPLAVGTLGYLPRFMLGGGESLPPGVARDWARWALSDDFLAPDRTPGFAAFGGRLRAFAVAGDDLYAPRPAVERFATFYRHAREVEVRTFAARAPDGERAGHFTAFSSGVRSALLAELRSFYLE